MTFLRFVPPKRIVFPFLAQSKQELPKIRKNRLEIKKAVEMNIPTAF
jgi:hypothetical protein